MVDQDQSESNAFSTLDYPPDLAAFVEEMHGTYENMGEFYRTLVSSSDNVRLFLNAACEAGTLIASGDEGEWIETEEGKMVWVWADPPTLWEFPR